MNGYILKSYAVKKSNNTSFMHIVPMSSVLTFTGTIYKTLGLFRVKVMCSSYGAMSVLSPGG